jgi:phage baseplate assembly protein W
MTELVIKKTKFVDIDLNFSLHPISSDIGKRVDANAISTSIKNLVLTNKYDRLFHPEIASQVTDLLFENFTGDTALSLQRSIRYTIENFEPRAEVVYINIVETPDSNDLTVELAFNLVGFLDTITTTFTLERII